jgi:hypothetical protein
MCPHVRRQKSNPSLVYCTMTDKEDEGFYVNLEEFIKNKTIPKWCQLEDK